MNSETSKQQEPVEADVTEDIGEDAPPAKTHSRLLRWVYVPITAIVLLFCGILIGAFIRFADDVASLKSPSENPTVDAVVVLTGGTKRITEAVNLLENGVGERLFISGVNPDISEGELMRVSGASKNLFNCCIEFGREAKDTSGNGLEIVDWAEKNNYKSLAVVTSNYHMIRSLYELRNTNSAINYVPYPVANTDLNNVNWFEDNDVFKALIFEFTKLNYAHLKKLAASMS